MDKWKTRLVSSSLILAMAMSACSSSSSTSSGSSSAASSSSNDTGSGGSTATPLKIGVICTCSGGGGLGAVILPTEEVYKAWADTVNASGGINGHPVQLVTKDDGGVPGTSVSDVQALISDHVVAIADMSFDDATWESMVQAAKIPVVGGLSYGIPFYTNPDFYPEAQTIDSSFSAVASTAKRAGASDFAYIYCAEAASCAQALSGYKAAGAQIGVPLTYTASISATAPNYTAQCLAAKQKKVSAVSVGEPAPLIIRVAADCAQQGYNPIYVFEAASFEMEEISATGLKENSWYAFPTVPYFSDSPAVHTAKAAVDKYYPGLWENGSLFSEQNFFGWPSGLLLEDAVKAGGLTTAGTPSAAEIVTGLQSLKGDTLQGLVPPLSFAAGQTHSIDCWFTAQVKDGTPVLLGNGQATCAKTPSS